MRLSESAKRAIELPFLIGVLASTTLIATACTDEAAQVKIGMKEQEVRELLGEPSFVVTDKVDVSGYLTGARDCPGQSVRILVYDRAIREDIFVGIDALGLVACKRGGRIITAAI